ncbi:MAG: DUF1697 domain-containing protein [Bacteroidetes bacterium]|nr:DUF1697 domain-containing protein [Bacteroidota bacterium]
MEGGSAVITCIALLRGINVGGQRMIKMNVLKTLFESLKLKNVNTYLQSGNVVFNSEPPDCNELRKSIENKIREDLAFDVPVILRTADQLENILPNNPFLKGRNEDITRLYVTFLAEEPAADLLDKLNGLKSADDEFSVSGKEIFLFCPGGYGNTKFSNGFFESKLKVTATTRNWKTVTELVAMAQGDNRS